MSSDVTRHSPEQQDVSESEWAFHTALAILRRLEARDYAGWDPYDALCSPLLPRRLKRHHVLGRAVVQAVKRSPVPLQPLLGVKQETDAYTLGHVLLATARLKVAAQQRTAPEAAGGRPDERFADQLDAILARVVERLRTLAWRRDDRIAWGYHFPVHTRFFFYEPPTPNVIVTAFVVKGLAEARQAGATGLAEEIWGAARFVLVDLPRVRDEAGQCFGYLPGEKAAVHNANLLAALILCEAALACNEPAWVQEALEAAHFSVTRQQPDGSWPYSEEVYGRWVDGFHTGFVLEGLARVWQAAQTLAKPVDQNDPNAERPLGEDLEWLSTALRRGVCFYVAQLFGPEGQPKYFPDDAYPLDALSAAQGVETLHVAVGGPAKKAVPGQLAWIREHLVRPDGRVAYQVHRGWTDWREFPRWSSAPLMSALAGVAARGRD